MYKHILVPTDGSKLSLKALKAAGELAGRLKARVTAIYVMVPFMPSTESDAVAFYPSYSARDYEKEVRKVADAALARAKSAAGEVKFEGVAEFGASPWEAIVKAAKGRKCDLIGMASHGRRGLAGLLLGSETQKVLIHSKIPVLVCR